jgi:hypothetical protein
VLMVCKVGNGNFACEEATVYRQEDLLPWAQALRST